MKLLRQSPAVLLSLILVPMLGSACGSSVSTSSSAAPQSSPAIAVATASPVVATGESGVALTEIATDNKFTPASYTIKTGMTYTLTLQNKGQAIHNWHILGAKGADGKDITTPIVDPGKTATFMFRVAQPGTYYFICDVHPDEMKGTLTVQ